jgi:hypothetical protein
MMSHVTHLLQSNPPSKILRGSAAYDDNRHSVRKFPQRLSHRPAQLGLTWTWNDRCQRAIEIQK